MANNAIQVSGLSELYKALQSFPVKLEGNIMRGGMRAGSKVFLEAARANVPKRSYQLRNSIRMSGGKDATGTVYSIVTAGSRDKVYNSKGRPIKNEPIFEINPNGVKKYKNAFYAHMVEFGTAAHYLSINKEARPSRMTRKGKKEYAIGTINKMTKRGSLASDKFVGASVSHPGSKPNPFMRPAYDKSWEEAMKLMAAYIKKRIDREGAKI